MRELRAARSAVDGASAPGAERGLSNRIIHRERIVAVLDGCPEGGTSDKVISGSGESLTLKFHKQAGRRNCLEQSLTGRLALICQQRPGNLQSTMKQAVDGHP